MSVPMVSIGRIVPNQRVDMLKVDIEGDEGDRFAGVVTWLAGIAYVMMEFHPEIVAADPIADVIVTQSFSRGAGRRPAAEHEHLRTRGDQRYGDRS